MIKKTLLLTLFSALPVLTFAADPVQELTDRLRKQYPNTSFTSVEKAPIEGLYEITMGKNIAYTDSTGRYFLFGNVYDMPAQVDVTASKRERLNRVSFPKDSLINAIKVVKGKGERQLVVFSDPDCPYCKQLEMELAKLDNVTIYTFLYPLEQLHPEAKARAISIWCNRSRANAWTDWMLLGKEPKPATCLNPIADNQNLGNRFGINGTPTMISEDGRQLSGAMRADQIDRWLGAR